jgi:hypothetical protein
MALFRAWLRKRRARALERRWAQQREDAAYAAQTIRAFLEETGGAHDWDDFTSCSLRDPELDRIRKLALAVDLPVGSEERASLEVLAEKAERLAQS